MSQMSYTTLMKRMCTISAAMLGEFSNYLSPLRQTNAIKYTYLHNN